jgi:hypothetical protein
MTPPTITTDCLEPLAKELDLTFDGDLHIAVQRIDEILFMLFYVDQDVINFERIQNAASDLKAIREGLRASQPKQAYTATQFIPVGMMAEA